MINSIQYCIHASEVIHQPNFVKWGWFFFFILIDWINCLIQTDPIGILLFYMPELEVGKPFLPSWPVTHFQLVTSFVLASIYMSPYGHFPTLLWVKTQLFFLRILLWNISHKYISLSFVTDKKMRCHFYHQKCLIPKFVFN